MKFFQNIPTILATGTIEFFIHGKVLQEFEPQLAPASMSRNVIQAEVTWTNGYKVSFKAMKFS